MASLLQEDVDTVNQDQGNFAGRDFAASWNLTGTVCIRDSLDKLGG